MNLKTALRQRNLIFDGSFGTYLQQLGIKSGVSEELNITSPETIIRIHKDYVSAGANVISAATFGANKIALARHSDADSFALTAAALKNARASGAEFVVCDIGPTGALMPPSGTTAFEEIYNAYLPQVLAARENADGILIETMMDLQEARVALLCAKENCSLPVIMTLSLGKGGRTQMGSSPAALRTVAEALGADCIGFNCSTGAESMLPYVPELYGCLPLLLQPNAGLPVTENRVSVYPETPESYSSHLINAPVQHIGGCCGTTPAHISMLKNHLFADFNPTGFIPALCTARTRFEIPANFDFSLLSGDSSDEIIDLSEELDSVAALDFSAVPISSVDDYINEIHSYITLPLVIKADSEEKYRRILRLYCGIAGADKPFYGAVRV